MRQFERRIVPALFKKDDGLAPNSRRLRKLFLREAEFLSKFFDAVRHGLCALVEVRIESRVEQHQRTY